jgi:hypothetical protein
MSSPFYADVDESEQGRIQGALYSLSALASALGPMTLRFVYHFTKDGAFVGPGSMFIFAAGLYVIASYCAYLLPVRSALYVCVSLLGLRSTAESHKSPTVSRSTATSDFQGRGRIDERCGIGLRSDRTQPLGISIVSSSSCIPCII